MDVAAEDAPNWIPPGRKEPFAIPAVKILGGTHPDCTGWVRNDILNVEFRNALLSAKPLKAGTDEAIDAVLGRHPQKSIAVPGQRFDRKVIEPFSLPVGAKNVLLRRKSSTKPQQTGKYPNWAETRQTFP